jgi:hypothetical protein
MAQEYHGKSTINRTIILPLASGGRICYDKRKKPIKAV